MEQDATSRIYHAVGLPEGGYAVGCQAYPDPENILDWMDNGSPVEVRPFEAHATHVSHTDLDRDTFTYGDSQQWWSVRLVQPDGQPASLSDFKTDKLPLTDSESKRTNLGPLVEAVEARLGRTGLTILVG